MKHKQMIWQTAICLRDKKSGHISILKRKRITCKDNKEKLKYGRIMILSKFQKNYGKKAKTEQCSVFIPLLMLPDQILIHR